MQSPVQCSPPPPSNTPFGHRSPASQAAGRPRGLCSSQGARGRERVRRRSISWAHVLSTFFSLHVPSKSSSLCLLPGTTNFCSLAPSRGCVQPKTHPPAWDSIVPSLRLDSARPPVQQFFGFVLRTSCAMGDQRKGCEIVSRLLAIETSAGHRLSGREPRSMPDPLSRAPPGGER